MMNFSLRKFHKPKKIAKSVIMKSNLRSQRHWMHRESVAVEASARFAGEEAGGDGARMRPARSMSVRMRNQQLTRDERGAALGAQVASLGGVLRQHVRAQLRARVEKSRACAARDFRRRVARHVAFEALLRVEDAAAALQRANQPRPHAQVRAQHVLGQVAPLVAAPAEVALDQRVQVHVAHVRLDVAAQARGEVAAHVALEHARRHLHDPFACPLRTRGLCCSVTTETN